MPKSNAQEINYSCRGHMGQDTVAAAKFVEIFQKIVVQPESSQNGQNNPAGADHHLLFNGLVVHPKSRNSEDNLVTSDITYQ